MSLLSSNEITEFSDSAGTWTLAFIHSGCSTLLSAAELLLPATKMTDHGYYSLFSNCSKLTKAPDLPATTLSQSCYQSMFAYCKALTDIPALPATTVASYCYSSMFNGCLQIETAPALPATSLASFCYHQMFQSCWALTTAPDLPATSLASNCYQSMFKGCSNLITAPNLPALVLVSGCYNGMFEGCFALKSAPDLPAKRAVSNCYARMFFGCILLEDGPQISITKTTTNWANCMFFNCNSLRTITTDQTDFDGCNNWVAQVAETGTLSCPQGLGDNNHIDRGISACPQGWNVARTSDYWGFYVEADTANATVKMAKTGSPSDISLEYSQDNGETWSTFNVDGQTTVTLSTIGDRVYFRSGSSGNAAFNTSLSIYRRFVFSGSVRIGGNIMSLLAASETDVPSAVPEHAFTRLFYNTSAVKDIRGLSLPTLRVRSYSYAGMFEANKGFTHTPRLPAVYVSGFGYSGMFRGCTGLTTASDLSAIQGLADCTEMFDGCTKLSTPPKLPMSAPGFAGYLRMFHGCTSLVHAPLLPASTIDSEYGYSQMFDGCTKLKSLTTRQTSFGSSTQCLHWLVDVSATGYMQCPTALGTETSIARGTSACPEGWNVSNVEDNYYFYVEARGAYATVKMEKTGNAPTVTLEYSTNCGATWTNFDVDGGTTITLVDIGDRVWFRAGASGNTGLASSGTDYRRFSFLGKVAVGGNIMSLLSQSEITEFPSSSGYQFCELFYNAPTLEMASDLVLPATTLATYCYSAMFNNCTSLAAAPALPATTLATYCYCNMFHGCTSLTTAPALPATTLANNCYASMFNGCTLLAAAPALPATTLASGCYNEMFRGCTALTAAPALPATTLADYCYQQMFQSCSTLRQITTAHTAWSPTNATTNWVSGVSSSGTFTCPAALPQTRGVNNIPNGWTIVTT